MPDATLHLDDRNFPWVNRFSTSFTVGPNVVHEDKQALVIADLHLTLGRVLRSPFRLLWRTHSLIVEH
jgi:hypothetical protein